MSTFDAAKERSEREHFAWSAAERKKLAGDPAAIVAAIKNGAIFSLTKEDRDALIAGYGGAKTPPADLRPVARKVRAPQPLEPATKRASARQSWLKGEFAHACAVAARRWVTVMSVGIIALEVLWTWERT